MKSRKIIALLLTLALLLSCFLTGCGNSGETSDDDAQAQGDAVSQEEGPKMTADGKYDCTITVMVYDRGTIPSSEGDLNNNRWANWIRENCPVANVEFIPVARSEATKVLSSMMAAGEGPDIICAGEDLAMFNTQGMCLEITDEMLDKMPNYKALLEKYPVMLKSSVIDGKLVLFGGANPGTPNHTIVIRRDWLDNLGLELPETLDDLYNILYAFTYDDPDGNGVDDTWGMNMTTDAQRVLSHMFGFGNPMKYNFNEDGELYYVWDRIESWLEYSEKIVDAGLVNPDFVTMKADDDQADFLNGKIGVYCSGRFTNANRETLYKNFKANFPDATLDTFRLPETEYGQYMCYRTGGTSQGGFINANVDPEKLDAILAFQNWKCSPEVSEYLNWGEDGEYYQKNEYGTWFAVDAEKNAIEYDYHSDYASFTFNNLQDTGYSLTANQWYNRSLTTDDPIVQEFGDLFYKMSVYATEPGVEEPRQWFYDGHPNLPTELALIQSTTDTQINNMLVAALADKNVSAADAVAEAKAAWIDAGGEQVDEYYRNWYAEQGDNALLWTDLEELALRPEMTPAARANSKLGDEWFDLEQ